MRRALLLLSQLVSSAADALLSLLVADCAVPGEQRASFLCERWKAERARADLPLLDAVRRQRHALGATRHRRRRFVDAEQCRRSWRHANLQYTPLSPALHPIFALARTSPAFRTCISSNRSLERSPLLSAMQSSTSTLLAAESEDPRQRRKVGAREGSSLRRSSSRAFCLSQTLDVRRGRAKMRMHRGYNKSGPRGEKERSP